ncbi:hypothetical protein INR49_004181 [Caranx melampygus]|nr:hypothetical protein INR49_004181 [Caranx melampygus]
MVPVLLILPSTPLLNLMKLKVHSVMSTCSSRGHFQLQYKRVPERKSDNHLHPVFAPVAFFFRSLKVKCPVSELLTPAAGRVIPLSSSQSPPLASPPLRRAAVAVCPGIKAARSPPLGLVHQLRARRQN